MAEVDRTACRTPAKGKSGVTRIPTWKYDLMREHILAVVGAAGPDGFPFQDLASAVGERITDAQKSKLGSLGWHSTTVKLELEVAGDLKRMEGVSPQRLLLG